MKYKRDLGLNLKLIHFFIFYLINFNISQMKSYVEAGPKTNSDKNFT